MCINFNSKLSTVHFKNRQTKSSMLFCGNNQPQVKPQPLKKDEFNKSNKNLKTGIMAGAGLAILTIGGIVLAAKNKTNIGITPYSKMLAGALSNHLGLEIKPKQLKNVISGKELLEELKTLKKENFAASENNIKNGIFRADLHSHSNYSDGKASVATILDQVASYANHVKEKTGKEFLYALTDHDNAEGVKEALTIIAGNQDKFKNVKFVTGAEMSFAIKADKKENPYETIEVLVYGFNPFDKKIDNHIKGLHEKRKNLANQYIDELQQRFGYAEFSFKEYSETFNINPKCISANNQWTVHHYGQTKNAISGLANSKGRNKSEMYKEIMNQTDARNRALGNLRDKGLVPKSYGDDSRITDLCKNKYAPHNTKDGVDYAGESTFASIVDTFGQNDDTFIALAHPFYITERNSNAQGLVNDLVNQSRGYLKATESYHQAYTSKINLSEVDTFNKSIVNHNKLLELGGRDNHNPNWLDIKY